MACPHGACVVTGLRERLNGAVDARGVAFEMHLAFDRNDPLALYFEFPDGEGTSTWAVCRQMVFDAAERGMSVGVGDCRLWPASRHMTGLWLESPVGTADLRLPTRPLVKFLRRTYDLVPRSQEQKHVDVAVDAALRQVTS